MAGGGTDLTRFNGLDKKLGFHFANEKTEGLGLCLKAEWDMATDMGWRDGNWDE